MQNLFLPHFYNITYPEDTSNNSFETLTPTHKPAQCYMSALHNMILFGNYPIKSIPYVMIECTYSKYIVLKFFIEIIDVRDLIR
jgi:hypothetical protein